MENDQQEEQHQYDVDCSGEENLVEFPNEGLDSRVMKDVGVELINFVASDCLLRDGDGGYSAVILPTEFSQSTLNGRNGSNACSVISVLIGYFSTTARVTSDTNLFNDIIPIFVGCMEIGNTIHDGPELLTIQDAMSLLPGLGMEISDERNCFLEQLPQHVKEQLGESDSHFLAIITAGRTVCIAKESNSRLILFDSHQRQDYGALILRSKLNELDTMCRNISDNPAELIYICLINVLMF